MKKSANTNTKSKDIRSYFKAFSSSKSTEPSTKPKDEQSSSSKRKAAVFSDTDEDDFDKAKKSQKSSGQTKSPSSSRAEKPAKTSKTHASEVNGSRSSSVSKSKDQSEKSAAKPKSDDKLKTPDKQEAPQAKIRKTSSSVSPEKLKHSKRDRSPSPQKGRNHSSTQSNKEIKEPAKKSNKLSEPEPSKKEHSAKDKATKTSEPPKIKLSKTGITATSSTSHKREDSKETSKDEDIKSITTESSSPSFSSKGVKRTAHVASYSKDEEEKPSILAPPSKKKPTERPSSSSKVQVVVTPPSKKLQSSDEAGTPETTPGDKKRNTAGYFKFLSRGPPPQLGSKEIPEGAPNCFANLTFVLTGVLPSFERDDIVDTIKGLGGRVTGSVSKKTSYLIVGNEAGESKTRKGTQLGIPQITEDQLLDMIRKTNPNASTSIWNTDVDMDTESKATGNESLFENTALLEDSDNEQPIPSKLRFKINQDESVFEKSIESDIEEPIPSKLRKTHLTPMKRFEDFHDFDSDLETPPKVRAQRNQQAAGSRETNKNKLCSPLTKTVEATKHRYTVSEARKLFEDDDDDVKPSVLKTTSPKSVTSSKVSPSKGSSSKDSPSKGSSSKDSSSKDSPSKGSSSKVSPSKDSASKASPTDAKAPKTSRAASTSSKSVSPEKRKTSSVSAASPGPSKMSKPITSSSVLGKTCSQPTQLVVSGHPPLMWVDKYKPASLKNVVGQTGDSSNAKKLLRWLTNWFNHHGSASDKAKAAWPGLRDPEGKTYKAALLSGPPGVGKTTTAHLCCKELNYNYFETNASVQRNKKGLHEKIGDSLSNMALNWSGGIATAKKSEPELMRKHVLIMDEVDGMSGNEDRGGIQELIGLIKSSRVPIICICNDRNHPKIRSLANYCFDLRFTKPRNEQLKSFVQSICFKEKIKVPPENLQQLIISTDQDIRQILHQLQMFSETKSKNVYDPRKDLRLGPWDVARKVFSAQDHQGMTINDKASLFFQDYSIGPLFVQENYLRWTPRGANGDVYKTMDLVKSAAECLAIGDRVENLIRRNNNWSLLPVQAIFSSVLPGEYMEGFVVSGIDFPQWLGKNSNRNKRARLLQQLHNHMHLQVSGSLEALNMDYLPYLRRSIVNPLVKGDIDRSVGYMSDYCLLREDLDNINELALWPNMRDHLEKLDSKTKAAFTRQVNKESFVPYSVVKVAKTRGKGSGGDGDAEDELEKLEGEEEGTLAEEDEEDETVEHDAMIKIKKPRAKAGTSSKASGSGAGTSKAKAPAEKGKRGKGKAKGSDLEDYSDDDIQPKKKSKKSSSRK